MLNADPQITGVTPTVDPVAVDEIFSLNVTFTDLGIDLASDEAHTINIDWGDGTSDSVTGRITYNHSTHEGMLTVDHSYSSITPNAVKYYDVEISVEDYDGGISAVSHEYIGVYADVDIDTDSNNNGAIDEDNGNTGPESSAEDSGEENDPGKIVLVGGEMAEVRLGAEIGEILDSSHTWTVTLTASGDGGVKIWNSAQDTNYGSSKTWTFDHESAASDTVDTTVWVEALDQGDVTMELALQSDTGASRDDTIKLKNVELESVAWETYGSNTELDANPNAGEGLRKSRKESSK